MNLLVINDNEDTVSLFSEFFNSKGVSISFSNDPLHGLNLIRQKKFDSILLDVNMTIAGGIGVIELLASDDILKDQNIFIFSEEDIPNIQLKNFLRRDGISGFLKSPINTDQLLTVIAK